MPQQTPWRWIRHVSIWYMKRKTEHLLWSVWNPEMLSLSWHMEKRSGWETEAMNWCRSKLSTPISNGGLIFTAPLRYAGSAPWAGFTDTIHAGCLLSGGHLSFEFIIFFLVSNIFPNRFLVHIADCCNVISSCPEMLISSFCSKLWMSVKQHQRTFTFQVRHEI